MRWFEKIVDFSLEDQLMFILSRTNDLNDEDVLNRVDAILQNESFSYEIFLGKVIFNRMNGIIFKNMTNFNIRIHREVKLYLNMLKDSQEKRNSILKKEVMKIGEALNNNLDYIFLKGSILNYFIYDFGLRISNDIDILCSREDLTKISEILYSLGYKQGIYDNASGKIIEATKAERLFKQLNTHELFSFVSIKEDGVVSKLDINFQLDGALKGEITKLFIDERIDYKLGETKISSLPIENMYIHLAVHFYREVAMVGKIMQLSDLLLYKLYDFYYLISNNYITKSTLEKIKVIATELGLYDHVKATHTYLNLIYPDFTPLVLEDLEYNSSFLNQYYIDIREDTKKLWKLPLKQRISNPEKRLELTAIKEK
ncbi:hypothetical protein DYZ85_00744 [Listeria monocytogenes]|uniref:nucleotidyltransferase family protein n=1 Tax=Listeria monocytogenes TaxID=1639 RepID=UPI000E709867|nr:nucleotidyltransferase family protein [Listeria monocytogenes]RKA27962.1 hypothetical protein DYZ85_00744 [Listeria monocytogenes]